MERVFGKAHVFLAYSWYGFKLVEGNGCHLYLKLLLLLSLVKKNKLPHKQSYHIIVFIFLMSKKMLGIFSTEKY